MTRNDTINGTVDLANDYRLCYFCDGSPKIDLANEHRLDETSCEHHCRILYRNVYVYAWTCIVNWSFV